MGLDMNAYATKHNIAEDFGFEVPVDELTVEIKYWRKFNNLHGWMVELYHSKGGNGDFNCVNLKLTVDDIIKLRTDASSLEPVEGFFFGGQDKMDDESIQNVLDFCDDALKKIEEGNTVFYWSWW